MGPGSGQRATETRLNPARGCSLCRSPDLLPHLPQRVFRSPGTCDPARCLVLARSWSPAASEGQPLGWSTDTEDAHIQDAVTTGVCLSSVPSGALGPASWVAEHL